MAEKALKQPDVFVWTGTDKRGVKVKGQSRGSNPNIVRAELRKQGIKPLSVRKQSTLFKKAEKKKILPSLNFTRPSMRSSSFWLWVT